MCVINKCNLLIRREIVDHPVEKYCNMHHRNLIRLNNGSSSFNQDRRRLKTNVTSLSFFGRMLNNMSPWAADDEWWALSWAMAAFQSMSWRGSCRVLNVAGRWAPRIAHLSKKQNFNCRTYKVELFLFHTSSLNCWFN